MALPGRGRGLGRLASLGKMLTVTARFTLFNAKKLTKSEHNALQRGATGQLRLGRAVYNLNEKDALSFND